MVFLCAGGLFFCNRDAPVHSGSKIRQAIQVSKNNRYFQLEDGSPFFWMGDTGWLLFQKLDRNEAEIYLENRRRYGFNIIQAILLHDLSDVNVYGDSALHNKCLSFPNVTPGHAFENKEAYDYWDHVDTLIRTACDKGIMMALVPVWGSVVKTGKVTVDDVKTYGQWLAERYSHFPNLIWINGGDVRGDLFPEIWQMLGQTLHRYDSMHLITYHPFGRTQSSAWFHQTEWLCFNMFQSGHKRYDQRRKTDDSLTWKGEDNWKYVLVDHARIPLKPTLDGEPSYENIPQGLHDPREPLWKAKDVRRYAYWSVFAGAAGHTYGNNAVMQMHRPQDGYGDYNVRNYWYHALDDTGATQMRHLKNLLLSRPYFERVYDPTLLVETPDSGYNTVLATRGLSYAFFYTYTGSRFDVRLDKISGKKLKVWWMNPRTGIVTYCGQIKNKGVRSFNPRGKKAEGNDWVLILDDAAAGFSVPGQMTIPSAR
ncbi:glycoside hydrolase family 140 protein [bacterium]|nr:glycoside hydrolase family 140 protein [bacterium]